MKISLAIVGALLGVALGGSIEPRDYDGYAYFVVDFARAGHLENALTALGCDPSYVEPVGSMQNHYMVRARRGVNVTGAFEAHKKRRRLRRGAMGAGDDALQHLRRVFAQEPRQRTKRAHIGDGEYARMVQKRAPTGVKPAANILEAIDQFHIEDPLFPEQWHLVNGVDPANSLNVTELWAKGITGNGVNVAIVDDGLDFKSQDLKDNFFKEGSWDYNDPGPDPLPRLSDDTHGTRCAGEIAAGRNNACGLGVAYDAGVAGLRILSGSITDADEAGSLTYRNDKNHIYSCSWGPPDDGKSMEAPSQLIEEAMLQGVQQGRQGKGSIYVFASGNGGGVDDQCNFDGYTNSIMSITVSAIDRRNLHPYYSEPCTANLVVTYSSGSGDSIHTTDRGENECTDHHGGTSAAAPLAAGIIALLLHEHPDLTWRDVQHLLVQTAIPVNVDSGGWEDVAKGRIYHDMYGFGSIDPVALIDKAYGWKSVTPQSYYHTHFEQLGEDDNESNLVNGDGVKSTITIRESQLSSANFAALEHITVRVSITHERRGNVQVAITSPSGIVSKLASPRRYDHATSGFPNWRFMSVKHWGDEPAGDWTIHVWDSENNNQTGYFHGWSLQLWGSSIDPAKAVPYQLEDPEDEIGSLQEISTFLSRTVSSFTHASSDASTVIETTVQSPIQTTVNAASITSTLSPTKSFVRPTSHLPSDHISASHLPPSSVDFLASATVSPHTSESPTPTPTDYSSPYTAPSDEAPSSYLAHLKSLVSSSTWFVVAAALAILLSAVLILVMRRRRRHTSLFDRSMPYSFEPIPHGDNVDMDDLAQPKDFEAFTLGDDEDEDDQNSSFIKHK